MVIGGYADRHGRKKAMNLTILLMAAGTALIGNAPTYASIGMAALAIMILAGVPQGFSAGGEVGTVGAYLIVHAPADRRGLQSNWLLAGAVAGRFPRVVTSMSAFARMMQNTRI